MARQLPIDFPGPDLTTPWNHLSHELPAACICIARFESPVPFRYLAGKLTFRNQIIRHMLAATGDTRSVFFFQMAISVAHEITHILTSFLTGMLDSFTPPTVAPEGYTDIDGHGEAGRFWESEALGGIVEFYADPSKQADVSQAGIPYLFETYNANSPGQPVSMAYIRSFADGNRCKFLPLIARVRAPFRYSNNRSDISGLSQF